jgi:hypothetical protein
VVGYKKAEQKLNESIGEEFRKRDANTIIKIHQKNN